MKPRWPMPDPDPYPPPCILYVTQHFGPKYSRGPTEDGSGEGRGSCHRRHQCCFVETCVAEWRENMWDAAVEQRRAHLPREIGHNRRFSSEAEDLYTVSGPVVYTHQTS